MILVRFILSLQFIMISTAFAEQSKVFFKKQAIQIVSAETNKKTKINVEVADNPDRWEAGLMFRKQLKDNNGMIFIFPSSETRQFWMKNTFIDLSIGFFNEDKILVDIQEMTATKSEMEAQPPVYSSKKPAQYALEMPTGWFKKHKIKVGDKLVL